MLVNPVAGLGGSVALKGSDGADVQAEARSRGGSPRAPERGRRALTAAGDAARRIHWLTWGGEMGARLLDDAGLAAEVLGRPADPCGPADTVAAARAMRAAGVDLVVFCGGDGTARDLFDAVAQDVPVLGIPSGVKMHSGVFATTPEAAGRILRELVAGGLVRATTADVRDLDEAALRAGTVAARFYGELAVPEIGGFLQHTKEGGRENESLALEEIVAEIVERVRSTGGRYVLGPGGSLAAIKSALGMTPTLIGFDALADDGRIASDVDGAWIEAFTRTEPCTLIMSFTRRQGFLIGRGNQQLTPTVLRQIGRANLWIVGTRSKLLSLDGRPLLLDTDDPDLDEAWSGLVEVVTGYQDSLYYRVEAA